MPFPMGIKSVEKSGSPARGKLENWKNQTRLESARNGSSCNERRTECDGCIPSVTPYRLRSDYNNVSDTFASRRGCSPSVTTYSEHSTNFCSSSTNSSEEIFHTSDYLQGIPCRPNRVPVIRPFIVKPPISPKPDFHLYFSSQKNQSKLCSKTRAASKSEDSLIAREKSSILYPDIEVIRIPSTSRHHEAGGGKLRRTCSEERVSFQEEWLRPKFTNSPLDPAYDERKASLDEIASFARSGNRKEYQAIRETRTVCSERSHQQNSADYRTVDDRSEDMSWLREFTPPPEFCDDRLFLLSILPTLKKMDYSSKINAKVEMLNTLQKAAASPLRHNIQHCTSVSPSSPSRSPDRSLFSGLQNLKESYIELCTRLQRLQSQVDDDDVDSDSNSLTKTDESEKQGNYSYVRGTHSESPRKKHSLLNSEGSSSRTEKDNTYITSPTKITTTKTSKKPGSQKYHEKEPSTKKEVHADSATTIALDSELEHSSAESEEEEPVSSAKKSQSIKEETFDNPKSKFIPERKKLRHNKRKNSPKIGLSHEKQSDKKKHAKKKSPEDLKRKKSLEKPYNVKCKFNTCQCHEEQQPKPDAKQGPDKVIVCVPCEEEQKCDKSNFKFVTSSNDIKQLRPIHYCCFVQTDKKQENEQAGPINNNLPVHASKSDGFKRGPQSDDLLFIFDHKSLPQTDPFPLHKICHERQADIIDVNKVRKCTTRRVPAGYNAFEEKHFSMEPIRERPIRSKINICSREENYEPKGYQSAQSINSDSKDDEDKLFLLSMLPTLKKLNDPVKMDVKIEMMQIMQRSVYPDLQYGDFYPIERCM